MRLALMAMALLLSGCAGSKLNIGYDFAAKRLFAELEQPLGGYKK